MHACVVDLTRLHIVMASPKHLLVTGGGIIVLELLYGKDFSLLGFIICVSVLGLGEFSAAPLPPPHNAIAIMHIILWLGCFSCL